MTFVVVIVVVLLLALVGTAKSERCKRTTSFDRVGTLVQGNDCDQAAGNALGLYVIHSLFDDQRTLFSVQSVRPESITNEFSQFTLMCGLVPD
jgi:hypothetical protein